MLEMRNAVHLDFDGNGDLLLDFLGSPSRPLCNHLNPGIGNIGIGFDREVVKRDHSPNEEQDRQAEHDETIIQREIDEFAYHCCSAEFWNSSAFATTCWPAASPETISCIEPGSMSPPTTSVRRN